MMPAAHIVRRLSPRCLRRYGAPLMPRQRHERYCQYAALMPAPIEMSAVHADADA